MPSRKMLLLGAGALAVLLVVVVLATRGGDPSLTIERGDGAAFPLRGSLADDKGAIDDALKPWKDRRGASAGRSPIRLLYAGTIGDRSVVIAEQGSRLFALRNPKDRGWVVGDVQDDFDAFYANPVAIDGSVLLPAGSDWTYLPLRPEALRPEIADGLVNDGSAYGSGVDEGLVVEQRAPGERYVTKVFDTLSGPFQVDAHTYRTITDAARHPGRLLAIHAALAGKDVVQRPGNQRALDVLWTGNVPGAREAAVVSRDGPMLGLGLVDDPNGLVSSAATVTLGARTGALGAHRRDDFDEPAVGAAYVENGDQPPTLVAAAAGPVDHMEFLVGNRRFTRAGPVAVLPVDWDIQTTDALVMGRTAAGALVAPLAPGGP